MLDDDVLRFDVAVHHARLVSVPERGQELDPERRRDLGGQGPAIVQNLAQGLPAEKLDDEGYCSASVSEETSKTSTMFGCRSFATAFASAPKRRATSRESRRCG